MRSVRRCFLLGLQLQEGDLQRRSLIGGVVASAIVLRAAPSWPQGDPLPSWNEGLAKQSIVDFVTRTTTVGSRDWVPVPERIATFDNDGTLWTEQPMYVQTAFALDRVKALAARHPEWRTTAAVPLDPDRRS